MKKTALILAVIASAIAALLTAPAHAGGKRLQFGGPLGSFKATPYAKGTSHSHRRHSKKAHARKLAAKRAAAKKAHARKLAAQKAHARKLAAKKAAAKKAHARKLAAKKAAAKKAHARQLAAKKAAAKKAAARKIAARKAAAKKKAIAQRRKTEERAIETAAETEDTAKLAPVKASAIAGTNTLDFDREEADVAALNETEEGATEVEEETVEETDDEIIETKAELECKKYIPSAGLTITVPCGS